MTILIIVNLGSGRRSSRLLPLMALALLVASTACSSRNSFPGRDAATTPGLKGDGGALQVQIKGSPNNCPALSFAVSPPDAKVDEDMDVNATVADPDPADQISLEWTATGGVFGNAKVAHTTYTCTAAGPNTITLAASDGQCTVTRSASVYCYGKGIITGAGGASTGQGGAAAGVGSGGAGGGTTAGTGGNRGNGGSGAGTGTGTGGSGMAAACAGILPMQTTHGEGEACEACTDLNCSPSTDGCDDGLNSDADVQLCRKLYCCIRVNKCAYAGDVTKCWCGTDENLPCTAANGPCVTEFQDAAKSKDPMTIKLRFIDPMYPLGRANNLAACRGVFCGQAIPNMTDPGPYLNACMIP